MFDSNNSKFTDNSPPHRLEMFHHKFVVVITAEVARLRPATCQDNILSQI